MRELILMSRQYGQEEELYPLINMLLRENAKVGDLSVRDVHNKGSVGKRRAMLYGYSSFPDLAIFDEKYTCPIEEGGIYEEMSQFEYIRGCVEVKKWMKIDRKKNEIVKEELKLNDLQLVGELLWYGKVIYTNGLHWWYMELNTPIDISIIKKVELLEKHRGRKRKENMKTKISKCCYEKYIQQEQNVISVEIADLRFIYQYIEDVKNSETPWIGIDQWIKKESIRTKEWDRLKNNLAKIDWRGQNKEDKFKTCPENS